MMTDSFDDSFDAAREQLGTPMPGGFGPRAGGPNPGDDPDCPIRALGHRAGRYWVFNAAGEIRMLTEDRLDKRAVLVSLMGGDIDWAVRHFVQLDREGNQTRWFNAGTLGCWLVAECTAAGIYDEEEPRRGWGVWRTPAGTVLHLGDVVWMARPREMRRAGFREWGALWPGLPKAMPAMRRGITGPLPPPATARQSAEVESLFARWSWDPAQPWAAKIVTGLWAAGLYGASIRWRPHGLVVGGAGTGKTTLFGVLAVLSPLAAKWNDYSEAGLRQALTGRAAPLLLDEAEGEGAGVQSLDRVLKLLRLTSGDDGAQTVRGSPGGQAQVFEVNAQAMMGGILPPIMLPQDESRFTRVDLVPPPPPEDHGEVAPSPLPDAEEREVWRALAPALLSRALAGADRMERNFALLRAEIIRRNCPPRLGDQLGSILAARATMLADDALTKAQVRAECDSVLPLLRAGRGQEMEDGAGAVLMHLLQSASDVTRHGEKPSIGALVREALGNPDGEGPRLLGEHGLGLGPWPRGTRDVAGGPPHLFIANSHPRLTRLFEGTRWAGGRWKEDLRRLRGAIVPESGCREIPNKPRCTIVPAPQRFDSAASDDGDGTM